MGDLSLVTIVLNKMVWNCKKQQHGIAKIPSGGGVGIILETLLECLGNIPVLRNQDLGFSAPPPPLPPLWLRNTWMFP